MARWHEVYRDTVLMPDFVFACKHLCAHFLDAMRAHVMTVARLPSSRGEGQQACIGRLLDALATLRRDAPPCYEPDVPDLYFALNTRLETSLGETPVSFLRLGLSRNDLDMTVYKMRSRELLLGMSKGLCRLRRAILAQAKAHTETVLIAHTHHQPGQPTTVAHYFAAIENALARDQERLFGAYGRINTCPLGAAALAGSSHPLERDYTAALLGFDAPVDNSYDAVASSDWQVELMGCVQSNALTLSRFVCDLLGWASQGLFVLPDGLVQGSSIMPQKRNPVALEHARTRFSRALGGVQAVLYSSHNIPYGDLNDFGPDIQGAIASLFIQLDGGLALLNACVAEGAFETGRLAALAQASDTTATELADVLTREHGFSFQAAHRLVGALVTHLAAERRPLQQARPADLTALGGPELGAQELRDALDPAAFVRRRSGLGGPAPAVVSAHVTRALQRLAQDTGRVDELGAHLLAAHQALAGSDTAPGKDVL